MTNFSATTPGNSSITTADKLYASKVLQSPLYQRLTAAGLVNSDRYDIYRWVQEWRCVGGSFTDVLAKRTQLSSKTIEFFSQSDPVPDSGHRIGDYLVCAGLVTNMAVDNTLSELHESGQQQLLGQALAERHYISYFTANYFAETFTNSPSAIAELVENEGYLPRPSLSEDDLGGCMTQSNQNKRRSLEEFFQAAADTVAGSHRPSPRMRSEAEYMLATFPNNSKVKYWCARLGVDCH